MKNEDTWKPSKYVQRRGTLAASRDVAEVGVASRLVADMVASRYALYLPKYARGRLVDLGCGKVPLFGTYRAHVDVVTCVDWSNSVHANTHLDVETSLSERLPFADEQFDTIVLSDVLEHIAEPGLLWNEMVRILAPGGHLLLNVPFLYGIHEAPHDYYRYTSFALRRFAEMRGMSVTVLESLGGGVEVLSDLLAKHLGTIPYIGSALAWLVQFAARSFGNTGIGQKTARESGRSFPLGYFLIATKPVIP